MNPEQLKAALRSAGYLVMSEGGGGYGSEPGDPWVDAPVTYYYVGPRGRASATEAAAAIGVPELVLENAKPSMEATPEESASLYPSRGGGGGFFGGFFEQLQGLVTSPSFGLAASVIAPSILAAEAAGAAAAAAAPAANTGAGLIDASLGQAYADLGVGAGAPAAGAAPSVLTQPIATPPLATMGAPTPMLAADLAAYNALAPGLEAADVAGTAINNMLMPTATTGAVTSAGTPLVGYGGLGDIVDPFGNVASLSPISSPFTAPAAGFYGGAGDVLNPVTGAITNAPGTIPNYSTGLVGYGGGGDFLDPVTGNVGRPSNITSSFNPPMAGYGGAGDVLNPVTGAVTTGADAATGLAAAGAGATVTGNAATNTGAATNALAGYGGAGDVLDPVTGAVTTGADAAAVAGLGVGAFDALAKFAKDYGVPLSALISGITGSQAAKDAANVQAESAREARALAKQIFDEQKALQEPFRTAGITAQNQLLTLLGLPGGTQGAEFGRYARPFGMQDFQADPGYAFRLSEGMKALEASRAAKGGLLSGATGKALTRYGQDLGSQEYGNAFSRFQTERVNRLQPLGALMGTGQAAAANQGAAAGQYGTTAGGLTTDIGAARAAGDVGAANAITNALGQYSRYLSNQNIANQIRQSLYGAAIPG